MFCLIVVNGACLQGQNTPSADELESSVSQPLMVLKVFRQINEKRVKNELPRLNWDSEIAQVAREHSLNMANGEVPFGHRDANLRFKELRTEIPSLTRFGENVAFNSGVSNPVENAVEGWLDSPEHYENIMGDFNLTGIGVVVNPEGAYYFTQLFVKADLGEAEDGTPYN